MNVSSGLKSGTFTAAEAEFLPSTLALIEEPVSPTARLTAWVLVAGLVISIVGAMVMQVDIVVSATGRVVPAGRTKTIAAVTTATVKGIHVAEGQRVKQDDVLLELDTSIWEPEKRKADAEALQARFEIARATALIEAIDQRRSPKMKNVDAFDLAAIDEAERQLLGRYEDYRAKLAEYDGDIDRYSRALPLAQERVRKYETLVRTKDISSVTLSQQLQEAVDIEGELNQALNGRASHIAHTRREVLDSLAGARRALTIATEDAARADAEMRLMTLHAPVDGTVQQLSVHALGAVVSTAQSLMSIVPDSGQVEIEAFIDNRDVGFVREQQVAEVKVDAFDYTIHGAIHGEVSNVSRDAVADDSGRMVYTARIKIDQSFVGTRDDAMKLSPGMTVSADIKTGSRTVIQYILSPLSKTIGESLRER
jgi:hemolysin D